MCSCMADTQDDGDATRLPAAVKQFHQRGALPRRCEPRPALPHRRHAEVLAGFPHTIAGLPHAIIALGRPLNIIQTRVQGRISSHPCKLTQSKRGVDIVSMWHRLARACRVPPHRCMGS